MFVFVRSFLAFLACQRVPLLPFHTTAPVVMVAWRQLVALNWTLPRIRFWRSLALSFFQGGNITQTTVLTT
uniref:Putative secreted protein n=1 Tax=Anopheles darlingi TaxID=43151 RepID=A0A2M4DDN3_ANODA